LNGVGISSRRGGLRLWLDRRIGARLSIHVKLPAISDYELWLLLFFHLTLPTATEMNS
jgi:hypothetical protein